MMKAAAAQEINKKSDDMDWDNNPESSVLLAKAAPVVDQAAKLAFAKVPALIAQAMQAIQAMAPKPPMDPMIQVAQADVQGKHEIAKGQLSLDQQKAQNDAQGKVQVLQAKMHQAQIDYQIELQKAGLSAQTEMDKAELISKTDLAKTVHDNTSEQHIAAMRMHHDNATKPTEE